LAFSIFASSAWAQFGVTGGYVPYTVDAPAAAAAASARATSAIEEQNRTHCRMQSQGRGGERYQCDDEPAAAPRR
jgi:hypothetical protein